MSLALTTAAKLKPEINLAQALFEFEAILNNEDQDRLHLQLGHAPDATAVIALTKTLNKEYGKRRSRRIGARMVIFLESVQQFSSVIETFVSSNPKIAALLWGGIKFSLLALSNFSSYFEKLSILFMKIGNTCPNYEDFGMLYPGSVRLQKSLCDYYAVVVRLCTQAILFSRKPAFAQLSLALIKPFEIEFGHFQTELSSLAQAVRDEISLASKQAQSQEMQFQAIERREAGIDRKLVSLFRDKATQEQKAAQEWRLQVKERAARKRRQNLLKALSTYNHKIAWIQACKQATNNTASWIYEEEDFMAWMQASKSATLWCTGNLGSGKTVLSASVVDFLQTTVLPKDAVAYFLCRYDNPESLKSRTIIGSIANQLLTSLPLQNLSELDNLMDETFPDSEDIVALLKTILLPTQQYFIVIDGLDECDEAEVRELVEALRALLAFKALRVKIYCSSRPDVTKWVSSTLNPEGHIVMNLKNISADIERYIEATLAEHLESNKLQVGNPTIIWTIQETLSKGAQGMSVSPTSIRALQTLTIHRFLWVAFQIETICAQKTDESILAILQDLPKDLHQTFERVLSKIPPGDRKLARRIFEWVAVAKRPLSLRELQEATGVEPLQANWDSSRLINDMARALSFCCGSLMTVDEQFGFVQFTHHSVRQYLVSKEPLKWLQQYHIDLEVADTEAGAICVTYLNFGVFDKQFAKRHGEPATAPKVTMYPRGILGEVLGSTSLANKIALRLLKEKPKFDTAIQCQLEEASADITDYSRQPLERQYHFFSYAKQFWLMHTTMLSPERKKLWKLWRLLLHDESNKADKPWQTLALNEDSVPSELSRWIILNDHRTLLQHILHFYIDSYYARKPREEAHYVNGEFVKNFHSLIYETGIITLIELSLEKSRWRLLQVMLDCLDEGSGYKDLLLAPLAEVGHLDLIKACITKGADMNGKCDHFQYHGTRLPRHIQSSYTLLTFNEVPQLRIFNLRAGAWTPLAIAAASGHVHVVDYWIETYYPLLLRHRPLFMSRYPNPNTQGVKFLPKDGVPDTTDTAYLRLDSNRKDALLAAAAYGQEDVVHRFLDSSKYPRSDLHPLDENQWTPMMYAIAWGQPELVSRLIALGADVHGNSSRTEDIRGFPIENIRVIPIRSVNTPKPLMIAAIAGRERKGLGLGLRYAKIQQMLCHAGAVIDEQSWDETGSLRIQIPDIRGPYQLEELEALVE